VYGHLTDSTLQGHNITDEEDTRLAMRRTALYVEPADGAPGWSPSRAPRGRNIRTIFGQPVKALQTDGAGSVTDEHPLSIRLKESRATHGRKAALSQRDLVDKYSPVRASFRTKESVQILSPRLRHKLQKRFEFRAFKVPDTDVVHCQQ
jgi:hypothetical protein